MLLVVCGLPATGKTFLASELAKELNFKHLNTDKTRKKMLEKPSYSEKEKRKIYNKMLEFTLDFLQQGRDVILDGTFYKRNLRKKVKRIAQRANTKVLFIELTASEKEIRKRMKKRATQKSESDADFEVYKKIKKEFEPIKEPHLVIDSTVPLMKQVERVRFHMRKEAG